MDQTLERAAHVALTDLTDHGGGTYEAGTFLPFRPEHGFAVGIGGLHLPSDMVGTEAIAWALRAVTTEYEASYGGTWQDNGFVYFDAVRYIVDRETAIQAGIEAGQKAIFDFGAQKAITL